LVSRVVIVSNHVETQSRPGPEQQSKSLHVEVTGNGLSPRLLGEEFMTTYSNGAITTLVTRSQQEAFKFMPTNILSQMAEAMKPGLPHPGSLALSPLGTLLDLLAYGALAGVAHAVHFYGRYRERERRALFLESNLAQARLRSLQAQLHPHFLFNTLNAIATLLRRDPRAAETTLMSLSELLRLALSRSDEQEIRLREEMRFLERYMEIQQTRFGKRLRFEQTIEPASLDCLVPTLLLQPLVENAIQHGIEPSGNPGLIQVSTKGVNGRMVVSVEDDGIGLQTPALGNKPGGIGLSNLRARLEALYGAEQKLEVLPRATGGVTVRIEIPWRPSDSPSNPRNEGGV
jgi:two-component sensor histidine kinase